MATKKRDGREQYVRRMMELHGITRAKALGWWNKLKAHQAAGAANYRAIWGMHMNGGQP